MVPFVRRRVAVGDLVQPSGANAHRLGSFVVTGSDATEVEQSADTLLQQVRLHVVPEDGSGQDSSASTWSIS